MGVSYESFGRMNQKRRTRAALKGAAAELLRAGGTPTVAQVAEAALISKSTAYRYFPSQEALIAEVLLDAVSAQDREAVFAAARTPGTAAARLDAVVRADHAMVMNHEAAYRAFLRATLAPRADAPSETPRRPGNRLRYIADALAPVRDQLGDERFQRLVIALSMCVGTESIMVTQDIAGLPPAEAEAVKRWATAALLCVAMDEATNDVPIPSDHDTV